MNSKTIWIPVFAITLILFVVGVAGARSPLFVGPVADAINFQGRLTDPSGTPVTGTQSMLFRIYDSLSGGSELWASSAMNVVVAEGLFSVDLDVSQSTFDGQALWLEITVEGEVLSPRQPLTPAPYALGLRAGANVVGDPAAADSAVLGVEMTGTWENGKVLSGSAPATGTALHGEAAGGIGVVGSSSDNYGVFGSSNSSWGGYFTSEQGYGIRIHSSGNDHYDHGAYITANKGYGVYAQSTKNMGVRGEAGDVSNIPSPLGPIGVVGLGQNRGVVGSSMSGTGLFATSETNYGVWGQSTEYRGVTGRTGRVDDNYGLYTPDNLFAKNYNLAGAIMQVVQNGGGTPLEAGDVVVFNGIASMKSDDQHLIVQVGKTTEANSQAVAGVVYSGFNIDAIADEPELQADSALQAAEQINLDGPIEQGDYLLLVVHGPAQVKTGYLSGSIAVGDPLSTAAAPGYSARATEVKIGEVRMALPGTVFGKALEAVTEKSITEKQGAGKEEMIYVYVTLQ